MRRTVLIILSIFSMSFNNSQPIILNGVVLDYDTKEPIYANIMIGSLMNGSYTDSLGNFKIEYKGSDTINLTFSSIFYFDTEIKINERTDTVYLIRQKIKLPKKSSCASEYKILKESYNRPKIETDKYILSFKKNEGYYDTLYESKNKHTITWHGKNERYFQSHK